MAKDREKDFNNVIKTLESHGAHANHISIAQANLASDFHKDLRQKELVEQLSEVNQGLQTTTAALSGLSTPITEITDGIGQFIKTVKEESAASAALTTTMINESKALGRSTAALAVMTAGLAIATFWMAKSTDELVKQGQETHKLEREELAQDRQKITQDKDLLNSERLQFKAHKASWEKAHQPKPPSKP